MDLFSRPIRGTAVLLLCIATAACSDSDSSTSSGGSTDTGAAHGDGANTDGNADDEDTGDVDGSDSPPSPTDSDASTSGDDDADTSGAPGTDTDTDADTDGDTGSGSAHAVSGSVLRSVAPGEGNDAVGTLYLSLLASCDAGGVSEHGVELQDADLSANGASVAFAFEDVGPGTYFLTGFLDDNANFDGAGPDLGDLVAVDGIGPGCVEVNVQDEDVGGLTVDLNFVMIF